METAIQARGVPRTIAEQHPVSGTGTQPSHWSHITTIPSQNRRLLRDSTKEAY